jgi:uncharacterized membrane protein
MSQSCIPKENKMREHFMHRVFALGFVLAATNTVTLAQETQPVTTIDIPGATSAVALDVNDAGDVVGSYLAAGRTRGFLLDRNGQLYWIDFPGAVFTRAAGINARREIVGTYRLPTDPPSARHGFLFSEGRFTTIDPPGAVFTNPLGISEWGDIVGRFCLTTSCQPHGPNVHGFLLSDGEFTTIDVPGARGTNAWKINARGDIVGGYTDVNGKGHVFLLDGQKGGFTPIDVPAVVEISVDNGGSNSRRDFVATSCEIAPCTGESFDSQGFLLSGGRVTTIDVPGAMRTIAFGINERGDIVGGYADGAGFHGFLLSR